MSSEGPRPYRSATRRRQAAETRTRIVEAARVLLREHGFDGTTIGAIARAAGVAPQTVYGAFGSKRGIVAELFDRARFGPDYQALLAQARATADPRARLRFPARFTRLIYDAERATLDLLRGAGAVAPELAALVRESEDERRTAQAPLVRQLAEEGHLRAGLEVDAAADVLWMLTSRDVYRLLVVERGWSPARYEAWLGEAIARELLAPVGPAPPGRLGLAPA
jgi:AcrR family transcriptional regulator